MKYTDRSQLREEIKLMPGWKVHWACSRFVSSFEIFRRNSEELLSYLENIPCFSFEFFPDENARLQKIDSDTEVLRMLHNYIASATTLTDHCRRIKLKFLNKSSQKKYDSWIKESFHDPESLLVKQLRNFILHVDLPTICNRVNRTNGFSRVTLLPEKLLERDKWCSDVKNHLVELISQGKQVMLDDLVKKYSRKEFNLCESLFKELVSNHYDQLELVYSLNQKILESVKADGLISDPLLVQFFTRGFQLKMACGESQKSLSTDAKRFGAVASPADFA